MRIEGNEKVSGSRILLGVILIIIGGVLLLGSLNLIDINISSVIFSWPMLLIFLGIIFLINSRNKFVGSALLIIGLFYLLPRIFPGLHFNAGLIWPLILIIAGLAIMLNRGHGCHRGFFFKGKPLNIDKIDEVSVFGGGEKIISSNNFQGGSITSVFGGSEIDLRNCVLAPGNNVIDIIAIFGGFSLLTPKDWNVVINVTSIFGGISKKKGLGLPETEKDTSRTLILKGVVIFGGGEIKYV